MSLARVAAEVEHIEAEAWAQLHSALPATLRAQLGCETKIGDDELLYPASR